MLKSLGALPVFYIPIPSDEESEVAWLGSTLVLQVIDAMILATRMSGIKQIVEQNTYPVTENIDCTFGFQNLKSFKLNVTETRKFLEAFTYALTPPEMLEHALTALLGYFYPADNILHNKALAYYRQREWKIAGNFAVRGEEVIGRASENLIKRLLKIDEAFFGRECVTAAGTKRLVDEVWVCPGIGGRAILEMVNRVIVPRKAVGSAKVIASALAHPPAVVSIEDVN